MTTIKSLLTEGIEKVSLETAAESEPYQLRNYLKNYLIKHGLKVDEKESMKRSTGDFRGQRAGHRVDLYDGYQFRLHNEHLDRGFYVRFNVKGNKANVEFSWDNKRALYSTRLSDSTVEDYAQFIVDKWQDYSQEIKEKHQSLDNNKVAPTDIKDAIEAADVGSEFRVRYERERYKNEIHLFPDYTAFSDVRGKYSPKGKNVLLRLLSDPQVKRKLSSAHKKIGEDSYYQVSDQLYSMVNEKERVFDAIEKLVKTAYESGLKFITVDFDRGVIEFKMPRSSNFWGSNRDERPSKTARTRLKFLSEKEAIRKAKRIVLELKSHYKAIDEELIRIASQSDVAHMIVKRFFKEPSKYI